MVSDDSLGTDLPPPLTAAQTIQDEGGTFDLDTMRVLYDYGRAHADDARPWLLLARDAMRRGDHGFAVRYYRMAIDAGARAADAPGVHDDLLWVAREYEGQEQLEALELIEQTCVKRGADQ